MKLLFLDIDGVLNTVRSNEVLGRARTVGNLDPIALGLVQEAVKKTGAVVCLCSDWKFAHNYMELGKQLNLPILFETPDFSKENKYRGDEIQAVVDELRPEKFAILDDEEHGHEYDGMQYINVAEEYGVSFTDYLLLLEYLK